MKSMVAARRSDSRVGVQSLPLSLHWLSTADPIPASHLSAVWLSSPVPTEVVSGKARAAHVSRMPMGENKAAASQKHRHRRLQGSLPDQGEEPWGGSPDLQASEDDVLLVWDE